MKAYAGIGSRQTPPEILTLCTSLAALFAQQGWTCRTGGAPGADQAWEAGAGDQVELWLPWQGFEGRQGLLPTAQAFTIAEQYHPGWQYLKQGARKLMARNVHQVLGEDLQSPVKFVVCWTPDGSVDGSGSKSGGTGQALRIAAAYDIPVRNLAREEDLANAQSLLSPG